ncbi:MAG: LptF/LptG family permease [Cytophagaceae bacterium]|nr:LptF/LptG family permease [Gemmatimonadaceae bacterium]
MVSELECIPDRGERRRFALGAIAAILRLSLSDFRDRKVHAPDEYVDLLVPAQGAIPMNPLMPKSDRREILRRHVLPLAITAASLTAILLTNFVVRQLPYLSARGAPSGTIAELSLLSVPFIAAMTIPMAVFVAVCWVFARLSADGTIAQARQKPGGVRRLVAPVLGAALCLSAITLVSNTQLIPRANTRLLAVMSGRPPEGKTDRMMTIAELREAAREVRGNPGLMGVVRASRMAAAYEVEIHKKYALGLACVFFAIVGAALGLRFPRGGAWMVIGASVVVFGGYYACLVAGEALADTLTLSPFVAMWLANAVLLVVAFVLTWRRDDPRATRGAEPMAIGG